MALVATTTMVENHQSLKIVCAGLGGAFSMREMRGVESLSQPFEFNEKGPCSPNIKWHTFKKVCFSRLWRVRKFSIQGTNGCILVAIFFPY